MFEELIYFPLAVKDSYGMSRFPVHFQFSDALLSLVLRLRHSIFVFAFFSFNSFLPLLCCHFYYATHFQ